MAMVDFDFLVLALLSASPVGFVDKLISKSYF